MIFIDYQNQESADLYQNYLKSGKEFIYFKYLEWDTCFFRKTSYMLDLSRSNFEPSQTAQSLIEKQFEDSFVTAKIDTSLDYKYTYFLQQCGFYYVDTEIKLQNTFLPQSKPSDVNVEELYSNNLLPLQELGEAFSLTRFHCDPHISIKEADEVWISYLKNFVPSDTKKIYAAKINGEIAGVILSILNDHEAFLFFVAVLEPYRSKKIGSELMQQTIKMLGNEKPIYTGTQAKNIPALNFYMGNGFSKIVQTNTVLHYWH